METNKKTELKKIACKIRMGVIEGTFNAKSGHPGGSLSIAEITELSKRLPVLKEELDEKSMRWLELSEIGG